MNCFVWRLNNTTKEHTFSFFLLFFIGGAFKEPSRSDFVLPSPATMPQGCRFQPRCPFALEKCKHQLPELQELATDHKVRCWLHEEGEVAI